MGSDNPKTKSSKARPAPKLRWERGQILLLTALLMPILMGFTGLAIDVGMLTARRTNQQAAADSAVIAGAMEWFHDGTANRTAEAEAFATKNGYTTGTKNTTVSVSYPNSCGIIDTYGTGKCMKVTITRTSDTFFMRVLGLNDATITTSATAVIDTSPKPYALIVLEPADCPSYNHSGSGTMTLNGGGAIINSNGSSGTGGICPNTAAQQTGGATITASNCFTTDSPPVSIPCSLDHLNGTNWLYPGSQASPAPTTVQDPVTDPLATLERPAPCTNAAGNSPAGCIVKSSTSAGTWNNPTHTEINGPATLQPGTYYGGLTINSGNVTFAPGLYVFAGGEGNSPSKRGFRWRSSGTATVSGTSSEGVTFYNANYNAASKTNDKSCGALDVTSSGALNLRAPADTGTKGPLDDNPVSDASDRTNGIQVVTFWQADDCTEPFKYAGGSHSIGGILYAPTATLNVSGGGSIGSVQVIVDKVDYSGSANITINYTNYIDISVPFWSLVE